jgi:hypothetical protein
MSLTQMARLGVVLLGCLALYGCTAPEPRKELFAPTDAQMKIRSAQSRTFEVKDRMVAMRGVIAALVTAARFAEPNYYDVLGVTVTVRPQEDGKTMIRANAIYNNKPIDDPKVYQNFFASVERSLFLSKD